jgi:hypothetical protein
MMVAPKNATVGAFAAMSDWTALDARLAEGDRNSPEKIQLVELIKTSLLHPKSEAPATKYMAFLAAPDGETVCLEHNLARPHLWFGEHHGKQLAAGGYKVEIKRSDDDRHSALDSVAGFAGRNAYGLKSLAAESARAALDMLGLLGEARLDPAVIDRWVTKLRRHFPRLTSFDADPDFDGKETNYKQEISEQLLQFFRVATTPSDWTDATYKAFKNYNLLYWGIPAKLDEAWPKERVGRAIEAIYSTKPGQLVPAMGQLVAAWMTDVPDAMLDHARQMAGAIAMHCHPSEAIYFRKTVRDELYLEATKRPFPESEVPEEIFTEELKFARAVETMFRDRGLRPRSLLDVQSALWIIHHYPDAEAGPSPDKAHAAMSKPLNTILYGPPGTGKTYLTAKRAVEICDGTAPEDEKSLRARYAELVSQKRIEFVTFHQSFSYEEFVEGLRPTMDSAEVPSDEHEPSAPTSPPAGFRLKSVDGIFKTVCERAHLDRGDTPRLDRGRPIFKISLGRRGAEEDRISEGLNGNLIHLGWGGDIDWSAARFDSFEAIRREWNEKKDERATGKDPNIEMIYSFRSAMQIGDYVILSDGRDTFRAFGKVVGEYYYDAAVPYHPHRRRVEWLWKDPEGADRDLFYNNYFRRHSVYELRSDTIDWDALETIVLGKETLRSDTGGRPFVLVIDEINRANLSKVFGELITLLEPDKRLGEQNELRVRLPYSGAMFGVPANLHIIGTMNTADRSIALLDTALRRRFEFCELMPDPSLLPTVDGIDLPKVLDTINERIEYLFDREHQIGHAYFINCRSREDVEDVMRHKVIPLLAEYFYEDWSKVAAVLGDADEGEEDREGGFLDRRKLAAPKGMTGEGDASPRFRWSVRRKFDFSGLSQR